MRGHGGSALLRAEGRHGAAGGGLGQPWGGKHDAVHGRYASIDNHIDNIYTCAGVGDLDRNALGRYGDRGLPLP